MFARVRLRPEFAVQLAGAAAFCLPLFVYLRTLARDVSFGDSGELAAVAHGLGIAHPPGYPLFTLLGHLFSRLPLGTVAFRVGLSSALSAAAASWLIWRTALALLPERVAQAESRRPQRHEAGDLRAWPDAHAARAWATLAGTLFFAFARTPWSQAVIVEVYALQAALTMALLASVLGPASRWTTRGPRVLAPGLLCGLALTNHLTGVLLLPVFFVWLIREIRDARRAGTFSRREFAYAALAIPVPLLLYLYLPLRSRLGPALNWDYPETLERLLIHVTARQYHGNLGREGLRLTELKRFLTDQLPGEATLALPLLAAVGFVVLARARARAVWLTALYLVAVHLYNMAYPIHDIEVYYVPAILVLALWAGVGTDWLGRQISRGVVRSSRGHGKRTGVVAAALSALALLALPVLPLARNFTVNDQRDFDLAARYVRDCLRYADHGSVIVSGHWDRFTAPALYLQQVERLRPDVVILDTGRMASPLLGRYLARVFPELADACRDELTTLSRVAHRAERGQPYDRGRGRDAYGALQRALVQESIKRRPTYALGEIFRHPMFAGLHQHPEGLLVRMTAGAAYRPFPPPEFAGPVVSVSALRTPLEREVHAEYLRMLRERVLYLKSRGLADQAREVEEQLARLQR